MKNETRRTFIQQSGLLAAGLSTGLNSSTSMTFIHHVLFWAKNPENQPEKDQLFKALKSLGKLPMIQSAHVGKPSLQTLINQSQKQVIPFQWF